MELAEEQAGKLGVHTLVTADELVGEGKAGHKTTLLKPEDSTEGTGEEDTLNGGKTHEALGKGANARVHVTHGPLSLLADAGKGLKGVEEASLLTGILNVSVDEEGVHLGVDVLNSHLEAVKAASLREADLRAKVLHNVLEHNTVRGGKKGEHVLDKVLLARGHGVKVALVLAKIDLLGGPEGGLSTLVGIPDVLVLNGEEHEAVRVVTEHGLNGELAGELELLHLTHRHATLLKRDLLLCLTSIALVAVSGAASSGVRALKRDLVEALLHRVNVEGLGGHFACLFVCLLREESTRRGRRAERHRGAFA